MRALVVESLGENYAGVALRDLPTPTPRPGEVQECCGTGMGFNLFRMSMFKDEKLRKPWFKTMASAQGVGTQDLYFWGDADGSRYHDSYFDMYPGGPDQPAAWRHGDWITVTERGTATITGRSDATLNRVIAMAIRGIQATAPEFQPFTVHDLRRTFSTSLNRAA